MKRISKLAGFTLLVLLVVVGCTQPTVTYTVGEYGPGGGIVFYDQGSVIGGWRYLEVASMDLPIQPTWGPATTATGATALVIGTGEANTATIVSAYGSGTWYAARYCTEDISGGSEDWFLPSLDELQKVYENLKLIDVGNLKDGRYWSTSENDAGTAYALDFTDGSSSTYGKGNHFLVRPIRAFE